LDFLLLKLLFSTMPRTITQVIQRLPYSVTRSSHESTLSCTKYFVHKLLSLSSVFLNVITMKTKYCLRTWNTCTCRWFRWAPCLHSPLLSWSWGSGLCLQGCTGLPPVVIHLFEILAIHWDRLCPDRICFRTEYWIQDLILKTGILGINWLLSRTGNRRTQIRG
jgi:hypothetical protein